MNDLNYAKEALSQDAQAIITYGVPENGDTVIVNGTTLTKAASGGAAAFSTIAELEVLIEAISGINSYVSGGTIVLQNSTPGAAGNAKTIALGTNTGTMSISGPTFTGGVDATYTPAIEIDNGNQVQVDAVIDIDTLSAGASVVVTPQVSADKDNWIDRTASASLNSTGVTELHTTEPLTYLRYKLVLSGTNALITLHMNARPSNL